MELLFYLQLVVCTLTGLGCPDDALGGAIPSELQATVERFACERHDQAEYDAACPPGSGCMQRPQPLVPLVIARTIDQEVAALAVYGGVDLAGDHPYPYEQRHGRLRAGHLVRPGRFIEQDEELVWVPLVEQPDDFAREGEGSWRASRLAVPDQNGVRLFLEEDWIAFAPGRRHGFGHLIPLEDVLRQRLLSEPLPETWRVRHPILRTDPVPRGHVYRICRPHDAGGAWDALVETWWRYQL